jgi:hypothetical protein
MQALTRRTGGEFNCMARTHLMQTPGPSYVGRILFAGILATLMPTAVADSVPDEVFPRRVVILLAPDLPERHQELKSQVTDSIYRVIRAFPSFAVVSGVAVDAVSNQTPTAQKPNVRNIHIARDLVSDWILEVGVHEPAGQLGKELYLELRLRHVSGDFVIANGFGRLNYPDKGKSNSMDAVARSTLEDLSSNILPRAQVTHTHENRATLRIRQHGGWVPGLPGIVVRRQTAWSLVLLSEVSGETGMMTTIRMHGPRPGDEVIFANVRPGPGKSPMLSEYFRGTKLWHRPSRGHLCVSATCLLNRVKAASSGIVVSSHLRRNGTKTRLRRRQTRTPQDE